MENDIDNNIFVIKQLLKDSINTEYFTYIKNKNDKNVKDCNLLYTQVCYLIKLFLLSDFESNSKKNYKYKFDEIFIRFCFRLIQNNNKDDNLKLLNDIDIKDDNNIYKRLIDFYNNFNNTNKTEFIFNAPTDLDSNIHITNALSRNIQTINTNNIIINFNKYVKQYIKINLKIDFINETINNKCLNLIYNDIMSNTHYSNNIFHDWIDKHIKLIIPCIDKTNLNHIKSINTGIDNKLFLKFIKDYIKNNSILNSIFNLNNILKNTKNINLIYNDILNNTLNSNSVFYTWITENKSLIINKFNENNIDLEKELNKNPYLFISKMLFMNKNLEINKSKKKYQIIPLRTNLTPKFIPINTHAIVDLIDTKKYFNNIKNYYHNDTENGNKIWSTFFKFTSSYIKKSLNKGYIFNNLIYTNGYEIIYSFTSKKYSDNKNTFHSNGKIERRFIKDSIKDLSDDKKNIFIENNNKKKEEEKIKKALLNKEKLKKQKELNKTNEKLKIANNKHDLDILLENHELKIINLKTEHNKKIFDLSQNLDKKSINYNLDLKNLIEEQIEIYDSELAFINHCYKRNYNTIIDDYDNKVVETYNKIITLKNEINKNIESIKNKILITKNELNKHKKTIKSNKKLNSIIKIRTKVNKSKEENKRLINKLNKITYLSKQLNYKCENENLTKIHIKNIKLKIIILINDLIDNAKHKNFNSHLKSICNDDFNIPININTMKTILPSILLDVQTNKMLNDKINELNDKKIIKTKIIKSKMYSKRHKKIKDKLDILSKELNNSLKLEIKNENKLKELFKNNFNEYMKVDDMSKKYLEVLDKMNWVVIDPGMNTLFTMLSKDGKKKYNYTKQLHLNRTGRKKIEKKKNNYRKKKIITLENELSNKDKRSKTSNNYDDFKKYFNKKMKLHDELEKLYNNDKLNKMKWNAFINEKRSEKMLINDIKNKFGKDVVLILGDWCMNKSHIKKISPTPNKKYTNILNKNLLTLSINEFRTSIIYNKLDKKCENHTKKYDYKKENIKSIYYIEKLKKENEEKYNKVMKEKKVHKILVCKTNKKSKEQEIKINRDNNSVLNMIKIVESYIKNNIKPKTFVFGTKICKHSNKVLEMYIGH